MNKKFRCEVEISNDNIQNLRNILLLDSDTLDEFQQISQELDSADVEKSTLTVDLRTSNLHAVLIRCELASTLTLTNAEAQTSILKLQNSGLFLINSGEEIDQIQIEMTGSRTELVDEVETTITEGLVQVLIAGTEG